MTLLATLQLVAIDKPEAFAISVIVRYYTQMTYWGGYDMELRRIEAAIARLEVAARNPARVASSPSEIAAIEATNVRLREAVALSLRQIDALIAQHGTEGPR